MNEFLAHLKQRKLVQWALAYGAFAFALIQVLDVVADSYHWPDTAMHIVFGVLVLGFVVTAILAWYHGERGAQRVSGAELLLIALALAIGGGLLWHFARAPANVPAAKSVASTRSAGATQPSRKTATLPATAHAATTASASAASIANVAAAIAAQSIPAKSVAVLPFENLSTDKGNAYFADSIQDLILTKLADIGDLKVIARTSTQSYGSHPQNLTVVGQQLGVATILEGSVQKAGNQVLINVQLIDAKTDSHIWAHDYVRTLTNIFGVEGEVAEKVATALNAKLTPAETAQVTQVPTTNTKAYDAFLQGDYYWNHSFIPNADETAAGYYRQAVAHDPHFVLAWARLAHVLANIARNSNSFTDAEQAKSALDHAMALAPDSPDVRLAQGWYLDYVKKDLDGALAAFSAVAQSQPNNAQALLAIAAMHAHKGQLSEALGFLQKAVALAPKDKVSLGELVNVYQALHRYPDAVRTAQRLVAVDPSDASGILSLMESYARMGDMSRALAAYKAAPADARANPYLTFVYAHMQVLQRDYPAARKLLAGLKSIHGLSIGVIEIDRGDVEWLSGNTALAREHYQRAQGLIDAELKRNPSSSTAHYLLAWVFARLGRRKEALAQIALSIHEDHEQKQFNPFLTECEDKQEMAQIQAALGDAGAAVKLLDWLVARPTGNLISVPLLKINPTWDPIRHDPAFQALLKKYGSAIPVASASSAAVTAKP